MWTSNHGEPGRGEGCTESIELRTQDENDRFWIKETMENLWFKEKMQERRGTSSILAMVGGLPPEEEDPTLEQLSALHRRIFTQDTTQRRSYLVQLHSLSGGRASGFFEPPS